MKTARQICQYTPKEYELLLFDLYFVWCDIHTANDDQIQSALCNAPLFKWFMQEIQRLENEFLNDIKSYDLSMIDKNVLRDLFDDTIVKIGKCYSKVLLKTAFKTAFKTPLNSN